MPFTAFHPAVRDWFTRCFGSPSPVQAQAWPAIKQQQHTLLAAPTGSGKTLAAFLAVIDDLLQEGLDGALADETRVLYVSPLKALSNDIEKNLQLPLMGIRDELMMQGLPDVDITVAVRTGDTDSKTRERMRRKAPHILVTTPESLYILLTSQSGRKMLSTVRSVIVDEIHAIAGDKRGAHLMLSLERLADLALHPQLRIGISATQKPITRIAAYLTGSEKIPCTIVDTGHTRERDLAIEVPDSPLEAVMSNEVWEEVYDRLAELCRSHRTTLIFVNTRRLAERAARHLAERLGEDAVTSHHGSLAREHRLDAEQRLKNGELVALVATASLELGIDIGDIDLVCQLGSPGSISAFLQRVGRSGHALRATPKGRLFPLSRDDLVEAAALLEAIARGELEQIEIPEAPLDVLAQQLVAEVSAEEWSEPKLYRLFRRAYPYRDLSEAQFAEVCAMLAEGYTGRRGRRGAWLHRDRVNQRLRARRGARLVAITNGGAIPDLFDYDVVLAPEGYSVGTLNEDFAFESLPGDIFQLGNTSYRILRVEPGKVHVEDAQGQPPNIPFWFGEAPGRSDALSLAVSRLRSEFDRLFAEGGREKAQAWCERHLPGSRAAALQLVDYLWIARESIEVMPDQNTLVLERFFDETGDMHLVLHSCFGSRLNRAWGLALRKRFCRKFNFELQAAALEDSIILSLGATHSFPLEEVARYLNSQSVRHILIQALLDAPMFETHWRWCACISLAIQRNRNGKRVPAQWQRNDAEDLVAQVFPDQLACFENIAGEREVPDHPLVNQTLWDCLHDVMDIDGLESVLQALEAGEIRVVARDLSAPSVLAQEILNARPFAFLDDAPAEERRTLAVKSGRFTQPDAVAPLAAIDPAAVDEVRRQARPLVRDADELQDALQVYGFLLESEVQSLTPDSRGLLAELAQSRRACRLGPRLVAAERLAQCRVLWPQETAQPPLTPPDPVAAGSGDVLADATLALVRARLQFTGPVSEADLAAGFAGQAGQLSQALLALEQEGYAVRMTLEGQDLWCERTLLARIHRRNLQSKRKRVSSVSLQDFMRFLCHWHGLGAERARGPEALLNALFTLAGYPMNSEALTQALHARLEDFHQADLDALCSSGRFVWFPLAEKKPAGGKRRLTRTGVVLVPREDIHFWKQAGYPGSAEESELSSSAAAVLAVLHEDGASFFSDIVRRTKQLRTQCEESLAELVAAGLVTADSFAGFRALALPSSKRPSYSRGIGRRRVQSLQPSVDDGGRWSTLSSLGEDVRVLDESVRRLDYDFLQYFLNLYLTRYGVVFRQLVAREPAAPPWRELLPVLQKLEARGEVEGGRFVDGLSGIQFALPEAAALLRRVPAMPRDDMLIPLSAADPLNLSGDILPGDKISRHAGTRLLLQNGLLVASAKGQEIAFHGEADENARFLYQSKLQRSVKIAGKRFPLN
ncbi:DEAD/DEAH box helicase [Granulosicoccaceae sp. 1_MG-2023]|nr:DEAD/DEAH box helicase [Granulosicoccaceae sp. 1_MG-2023]